MVSDLRQTVEKLSLKVIAAREASFPESRAKWHHTAYVVTANTSFAFTIYGMKCGLTWDYRNPLLGQSSLEEC